MAFSDHGSIKSRHFFLPVAAVLLAAALVAAPAAIA